MWPAGEKARAGYPSAPSPRGYALRSATQLSEKARELRGLFLSGRFRLDISDFGDRSPRGLMFAGPSASRFARCRGASPMALIQAQSRAGSPELSPPGAPLWIRSVAFSPKQP